MKMEPLRHRLDFQLGLNVDDTVDIVEDGIDLTFSLDELPDVGKKAFKSIVKEKIKLRGFVGSKSYYSPDQDRDDEGQFAPEGGGGSGGEDIEILSKNKIDDHKKTFSSSDLLHTYKIVKRGSKWCAVSEDGTRTMGCYSSRAGAAERLRQVEAAKAAKKD